MAAIIDFPLRVTEAVTPPQSTHSDAVPALSDRVAALSLASFSVAVAMLTWTGSGMWFAAAAIFAITTSISWAESLTARLESRVEPDPSDLDRHRTPLRQRPPADMIGSPDHQSLASIM